MENIKKKKINTHALSGFMELLPQEQIEFNKLKSKIESTYHKFGFISLDTPLIERSEVLFAKGGDGINRQIYFVKNGIFEETEKENSKALRYDLTVPFARYVVEHLNDLVFPFKRCHIGKVYRGERSQRGRFREFYQCDIDIIGRNELSIRYDAEIPTIIYKLFKELNLGKFTIKINNRKILSGFLDYLDISGQLSAVFHIIDKIGKITYNEMITSFKNLGLTESQIDSVIKFLGIKGEIGDVLNNLYKLNISNRLFLEGVEELKSVTDLMSQMGVEQDYFIIDLSIVRGLDYYTGTIYETILDNYPNIGSICSGGRFDNLAKEFSNEHLPGVGISIGLTRLFYQLRENNFLKWTNTITDIVVVPYNDQNILTALIIANKLRDANNNVDTLLETTTMKKKMQYFSKKEARFVVIVKSDETGNEVISLQYKVGDIIEKKQFQKEELVNLVEFIKIC